MLRLLALNDYGGVCGQIRRSVGRKKPLSRLDALMNRRPRRYGAIPAGGNDPAGPPLIVRLLDSDSFGKEFADPPRSGQGFMRGTDSVLLQEGRHSIAGKGCFFRGRLRT